MKIAIQGHPTRGKEVIQILESLGGKNTRNLYGDGYLYYYLIDRGIITFSSKNIFNNCKYYTLEEFEKEFPFKVGDRVVSLTTGLIGTITKFSENEVYQLKYDNGMYTLSDACYLKLYKEMKEERNITLTLDKAKEWYKKGGELKEVALQAYSEEELTKVELPRTWEEFCVNYPIRNGEATIDGSTSQIRTYIGSVARSLTPNKNVCPSQKSAEAHLAMIQLEQLRDCWRQGWKPEWNECEKYVVKWEGDDLIVFTARRIHAFLVFPTREMAEEFSKYFRSLIETAKDLI